MLIRYARAGDAPRVLAPTFPARLNRQNDLKTAHIGRQAHHFSGIATHQARTRPTSTPIA